MMSNNEKIEIEKLLEKLTSDDLSDILSKTVKVELSQDVKRRIEKQSSEDDQVKTPICSYQCTNKGCNFDEVLGWVSTSQRVLSTDIIGDDEMILSAATAACDMVNKNINVIQPRKYDGYYLHHHNKPIVFLKNTEVSHPLYTCGRHGVASIDIENLAYYTEKSIRNRFLNDYMGRINYTDNWQVLAIDIGAAVLGFTSLVMTLKRKKGAVTPLYLGGLSLGMFGLNRYGQQQKQKK